MHNRGFSDEPIIRLDVGTTEQCIAKGIEYCIVGMLNVDTAGLDLGEHALR